MESNAFQSSTPELAGRLGRGGRSVYSNLLERARQSGYPLIPLHVGDTYLPPAVDLLTLPKSETMHQYGPVGGERALLEAASTYFSTQQGQEVPIRELLVTAGATGGLTALFSALLNPGDEAILLAPYWPLVAGSARLLGAHPIAVKAFQEGLSLAELIQRLEDAYSERTRLLYLNSPNNPTGEVVPKEWVEGLVDWAKYKGIWVVSDEVYDLFSFHGNHTYARLIDPERVISASSMSKAFGMAGYRCGFLQGPEAVLAEVERSATYTMYSAPTPAQRVAIEALNGPGRAWADHARPLYQSIGSEAAQVLGALEPQGGTFLFLDARSWLADGGRFEGKTISHILEALADRGVLLAPGSAFGPYPEHMRMCFTAAPPETVRQGVHIIKEVTGA